MKRTISFDRLKDSLQITDLSLQELHDNALLLLRRIAPKQTRYKVAEKPDSRTIRYYVAENLLPKPVSYHGGRANYSGRHLIRLLLIKKLQAEHFTLKQIKSLFAELEQSETQTESLMLAKLSEDSFVKTFRGPQPAESTGPALEDTKVSNGTLEPETLKRFKLFDDAELIVSNTRLGNIELKSQLADALETLAKQLRQLQE